MFDDVIREYGRLEPAGTDAWNPLSNEKELWGRARLFLTLGRILSELPIPISDARLLDVGCGVGHSTRALLEFGARPKNVLGIDLRLSAIAYARSLNPAMRFQVVHGLDDWPSESFDLCMQVVVFSSISGLDRRLALAQKMESMVRENGLIFWWDRITANAFAGGDRLDPSDYFKQSLILEEQFLSLPPALAASIKYRGRVADLISRLLQKWIGHPPTHCAALLKRKR